MIAACYSLKGLILILIGVFVGFTNSSTTIDFTNKKVKFSNNIFGFIKTGKWLNIKESMKIVIRKSNKTYRTYSRSNRILDVARNEIKIYLYDLHGNLIMPLKNIDTVNNSEKEIEDLNKKLGLTIIK